MKINIVTIFPEFFATPLSLSIPGRAANAGLVNYNVDDLRAFAHDKHKTVDDYPFGGGASMVMKPPTTKPIDRTTPWNRGRRRFVAPGFKRDAPSHT